MAQAATTNTDELLSQLAASEIDRLLSEADNGAPAEAAPATPSAPEPAVAEGNERTALLEAAGFESKEPPKDAPVAPQEDERSALLQAAGFESPDETQARGEPVVEASPKAAVDDDRVPIYLKPLVWMNAPLDSCPSTIKKVMGSAGIVTLFNALAVLMYLHFFKKH